MGMFDSLIIEIHGHAVEIQTKRFDCVLQHYHPGDVVSGAPAGVRVYFDSLRIDENYQHVYGDERETPTRSFTVFVVLVQGVFTDYRIVEGTVDAAEKHIEALKVEWSDSARLIARWLVFMEKRQNENRRLRGRVENTLRVLDYARRLRSGDDLTESGLLFKHEEEKRLDQGEDALDVIQSMLEGEYSDFMEATATIKDPLDAYRL